MEPSKWILPEWIDIVRYSLQINPETNIFPKDVTLKIQFVEFDDLWKIRSVPTTVEGFEIVPFHDVVQVINFNIINFEFYYFNTTKKKFKVVPKRKRKQNTPTLKISITNNYKL